jgi:GNAT superfamily N-acetyltransferase
MINIRKAMPDEAPLLVEFQQAMALETENLSLDSETVALGVKAVFDDPNKGIYYVALEEGQIIGCLLTTPEWSEWRNGTVLWIQSVFVPKAHRGKGVFRALYAYVQEMVNSRADLRGIRLYVDKSNFPAQKVYQAIGMDGQHYQLFEWMK